MEPQYRELAKHARAFGNDAQAFAESGLAPQRYAKVLLAYQSKKHAIDADGRINSLMRKRTLDGLQAEGITIYRLCKDLGINKGNAYAYLNKGDVTKVSKETARRMLDYASAQKSPQTIATSR